LVDAVMMTAFALSVPADVSICASRLLQKIRVTGVDKSSGNPSPSLAISAPSP
jgi:hypothetical protein